MIERFLVMSEICHAMILWCMRLIWLCLLVFIFNISFYFFGAICL